VITRLVTHIPVGKGRQFGFAFHPNFLAAGLTICVPMGMWLIFHEGRREKLLGWISLPGLVVGVWASGSRGGAICVALTLVVSLVILPRARRYAPVTLLSIVATAGVLLVALPSVGAAILKATRLIGSGNQSGSNLARSIVAHQGYLDWLHSPVDGVGLQVATEAQNVYLQELASGGLILFGAMSIYLVWSGVSAARLMPRHDLGAALVAVTVAIAALNIFEADLTDRFYYVPAAILVSLIYTDRMDQEEAAAAAAAAAAVPVRATRRLSRR
jgi:hypothetical protein